MHKLLSAIALSLICAITACRGNSSTESDDAAAYDLLTRSYNYTEHEQFDSALCLLNQALRYNAATDSTRGLVNAEIMTLHLMRGSLDTAIVYGRRAMALTRGSISTEDYGILCGNIGIVYRRLGMNDSAAVAYRNGLTEVMRDDKCPDVAAYLYNNLAVLYGELERYDEMIDYARKAQAEARRAVDDVELLSALASEGIAFAKKGDSTNAVPILKDVVAKADSTDDHLLQLKAINHLVFALRAQGKYAELDSYLRRGEEIAKLLPANNIAVQGIRQAQMNAAIDRGDYLRALDAAAKLDSLKCQIEVIPIYKLRRTQALCYAHLGNFAEAYRLESEAQHLADSLASDNIQKQLSKYTVELETLQKELTIAELERSDANKTARLWAISTLLLIVVAILTATILRFNIRRRQMRQRAELEKSRRYVQGIERERARLAREIHDGACNDLLAIGMSLQSADNAQQARTDIANLRDSLRQLSHQLMPPQFKFANIDELLADLISHKPDNKVKINYHCTGDPSTVDDDTAYQLYRITQEALSNVITHSGATHANVSLTIDSKIHLQITDNGTFTADTEGIGIHSMNDRAESIQAKFSLTTKPGQTTIDIIRNA